MRRAGRRLDLPHRADFGEFPSAAVFQVGLDGGEPAAPLKVLAGLNSGEKMLERLGGNLWIGDANSAARACASTTPPPRTSCWATALQDRGRAVDLHPPALEPGPHAHVRSAPALPRWSSRTQKNAARLATVGGAPVEEGPAGLDRAPRRSPAGRARSARCVGEPAAPTRLLRDDHRLRHRRRQRGDPGRLPAGRRRRARQHRRQAVLVRRPRLRAAPLRPRRRWTCSTPTTASACWRSGPSSPRIPRSSAPTRTRWWSARTDAATSRCSAPPRCRCGPGR